jgi:hypothetical protein
MLITRKSAISGKVNTMDINVTHEDFEKLESGWLIQSAMPHISADEREFIMTGITPQEWEAEMGCEDDEDDYQDDDDGQPSWEQEWEDFGEVYSDEY